MALTRKMLKALDIEGDKADQIIEAHTDTVDGLKEQLATYKADAEKLPAVQKELDEAREALTTAKDDGWKDKHDKVKKEFDDYKAGITAKEAKAAKEAAARAYFESKNITGKALDIAMRGSGAEIEALELGEDGKIKDAKALDALVTPDWSARPKPKGPRPPPRLPGLAAATPTRTTLWQSKTGRSAGPRLLPIWRYSRKETKQLWQQKPI